MRSIAPLLCGFTLSLNLCAGAALLLIGSDLAYEDHQALAVFDGGVSAGDPCSYQIRQRLRWPWLPLETERVSHVDFEDFLRRAEQGRPAARGGSYCAGSARELLILLSPRLEGSDPMWIRHLVEKFRARHRADRVVLDLSKGWFPPKIVPRATVLRRSAPPARSTP